MLTMYNVRAIFAESTVLASFMSLLRSLHGSSGDCHAVRKGKFRGLPALFCPASLIGNERAPISLPDLLQSKARAAQQRHV